MNTNSNTYTIIYSTIMVVVVAAILAFVSVKLADRQQANVDTETRQNMLFSINQAKGVAEASSKNDYISAEFRKYFVDGYLVDAKGNKVAGSKLADAFALDLKSQYDIMKQANPDVSALRLPVFVCKTDSGESVEVFALYGAGLWGPIWGYISLRDDYNTIYGATFQHSGETPGLGAEIAEHWFSEQFKGKQIFDASTFTSVAVVKGGAAEGDLHGVNAISGGTITSSSLERTIRQWLGYYRPYFENQIAAAAAAEAASNTDQHEEGNL